MYLQQLNANDPVRSEFAEIFSRFGSVSHAVILATVDNASRRRGFIVMSYHHEAKAAMDALNRKEIKYVTSTALLNDNAHVLHPEGI